jgi:uncharacterized membrane protein YhhN
MFSVNRSPSPSDLRWFAGGFLVAFPLLGAVLFVWFGRPSDNGASWPVLGFSIAIAATGIAGGMVTLIRPTIGRKLYIVWMTATLPIGIAFTTILLTVLYFLLLPVFSLIVRRQDPLRRKSKGTTYWEDCRPHEPTLERMRRPF